MKYLTVIFVLLLSYNSFSQTTGSEFNAFLLPQGYGIKLLNSSGNSSIFNDVSNLGFMNPASISEFENYSFGISYQVSSSIDDAWILGIGSSRVYNFYPQSFGGIVQWNDFTFGLGFGQKYNGSPEFGPLFVTSIQDPDGTGEFITPIQETVIHNYSFSAAYSLTELLDIFNNLSFGFRFMLNRFNRYEELGPVTANATDYSASFAFGLNSEFQLDDVRKLSLGISYETKTNYKAEIEVDANLLVQPDFDPIRPLNYIQIIPVLISSTPAEMKLDIAVDVTQKLMFLTNLTSVFWEAESNNLKNQIEISASALYKINNTFTPGLGLYYSDYNYKEPFFKDLSNAFTAIYIIAGLRINIHNCYVDLSIADSHLLSDEFRKQTIGKLSLGLRF